MVTAPGRAPARLGGGVAVAVGAGLVAAASAASLPSTSYSTARFGTIDGYGNGLAGALGALLGWILRPRAAASSGAAVLGAALTLAGSALVISDAMGASSPASFRAVGFALIGLWLIALSSNLRSDAQVPHSLATFGLVVGAMMTLGLASAPVIALGLDDIDTAPAWTGSGP